MKAVLVALGALLLGGCASSFKIPAIDAEGYSFEHSDTFGHVSLSADKVVSGAEGVTATNYVRQISYPSWSDKVTIKKITFPAGSDSAPK